VRIDDAGPRTWLLASAAAWALLAWLLATAGMGGRVEPLPPDPGLLKPLPPLQPAPAPRLGPLSQYREIAARPLFAEDRRPKPFVLQGDGTEVESKAFDYVLTSVLITPGLKLAILQPPDGSESLRVKLGEAPEPQPEWRLVALDPRSAVFEGPDGRHTMNLRVYSGVGGAAPTPVSGARRPGAAPDAMPDAVQDADRVPITPPADGNGGAVPSAPVPKPASSQRPPANSKPAPATPVEGAAPMTEQAQMEAIRQRIQQRRAKLRGESQSKPPAQSP